MRRLSIHLLGPFQVTLDGEPLTDFRSDKVRALLAYLAVEVDRAQRRERLAGLLWTDWPERSARANLRRALANLRQSIGDHAATPPFLNISRQAIQLDADSDVWIDVAAFTHLLEAQPSARQTLHQLEEAIKLYQGSFLEGFSLGDSPIFEEWVLLNRERLHRLALGALRRLAECCEESGEYERALQYAWRQVALDPWREKAQQQLMRLLVLSGQRGAALNQYETLGRLLDRELGVQPTAETTRLYEQIRSGELEPPEAPPPAVPDGPVQLPPFLTAETPEGGEQRIFVGRERELEQMNRRLDAALAGRGQVLFVTGDAGRGKTTLLNEFARRALDEHPDLLLAVGHCNAYAGIGDPYLPFRDVLTMLSGDVEVKLAAGVIGQDQARRLWQALPLVLQMLVERGPELIDIFVPGGELLARAIAAVAPGQAGQLERLKALTAQVQTRPQGLEQSHLFEQYANVLRGLAAQRPLLIVLDDLQWADTASTSLLFHLGRRIDGSRILLAGAYRPDQVALGRDGERHPLETVLTEFKRYFGDIRVDLAQTEESEARYFVGALLDSEPNRLDEAFRQALFRHTQGHPLFTIELVRALVDRGGLVQNQDGQWVVGPTLDWQTLPARVEGVIEERIGRLTPDLRDILSAASVEGEEFTAQVVARVQQISERQLLRELSQELERRHDLVQEREEVQVGCRHLSRYRFGHVLFQQYLYNALGAGERRLLHREIGSALEILYKGHTEQVAVQLARHYAGDAERERYYSRLAGEQAAAKFAHAAALRYLSRSLDLTPPDRADERYALLLSREQVFHVQGDRQAQKQDLEALEAWVDALGDGQQRAEVALRRSRFAEATGEYSAAIVAAQTVVELAGALQDGGAEAAGYRQWGYALWRQGDYDAARLQLERALTLARKAAYRQLEADCLRSLGLVAWTQGDYARSKTHCRLALTLTHEIGDRRGESGNLNTLGIVYTEQARRVEARTHFEQALAICRELGDRRREAQVLGNLGTVSGALGDYANAQSYFEQGLTISQEIDDRGGAAMTLSNLGLLWHHQGGDEIALKYSQGALALAQEIGSRRWQGYTLTNLGHIFVSQGRLAEAADAYQQALMLRRDLGQHSLAIDSLAGLANVSLATEDLDQATEQVNEILKALESEGLEGIEEPFRVYLTCYRVLRAKGDSRARRVLDTAHRSLQEQAAGIQDDELRRAFLENIAVHRELVSQFAKCML